MKLINTIFYSLLVSVLFSACVIARKKDLNERLKHVEVDPPAYCVTLKTSISDILSVKARIGNSSQDQNFMFDTGSPLAYSFKTKDSFNIRAKKLFRLGRYKFDYGSGSIALGPVSFNNTGFLVTDYILGYYKEVCGIIGSSIFQTSICELNFSDSTIKFSNKLENFSHIGNSYVGNFKPYEGQATPVIKFTIGKDTLTAFLDTGFNGFIQVADGTKIPEEAAEKKVSFRNSKYLGYRGKDRPLYVSYYKANKMEVLGVKLDSGIVWQEHGYYGRNLVGLSFLKKFIVTIDWIHHRIYLKPIKEIDFRKNIYTYGFTCSKQDGELHVMDIYKDSEFEKAGIKTGDVIQSINHSGSFPDSLILAINSNQPAAALDLEIRNKGSFRLTKNKLFR